MSQKTLRKIHYIGTPYGMGVKGYASGSGPLGLLREDSFPQELKSLGLDARVSWIDADEPKGLSFQLPRGDQTARTVQQNYDLRERVASAIEDDEFPFLVSGSCNTALGALGGLNEPEIGVIWLDAHADASTPESSESGFFNGMPLAIANGQCYKSLRESIPGFNTVAEERIVSVGMHDLQAGRPGPIGYVVDRERINQVGTLRAALAEPLDKVRERSSTVYLHIDTDVLDNNVTAVHGYATQATGGFSLAEVEDTIRLVFETFEVRAVNFANFDSNHDPRTIPVVSRLVQETSKQAAGRY